MKEAKWDEATNIFPELFRASIAVINPDATASESVFIFLSASVSGTISIDAKCPGETGFHEFRGEVGTIEIFDKSIDALVLTVAE